MKPLSLKQLKQHRIMGPLSWLLSAAIALPAWLFGAALLTATPRAAQAQALNRMSTWAVVDFKNTSGYGGQEIGTQASDGFVVELQKTNRYNIVPKADVQAAIASTGLVQPLDRIALQQLAGTLNSQYDGCDAVATGEVAAVTFTDNPRRATASVIIRVVDRISGELINGAVAQGTSTPRPIPVDDDDALVDQAISNADFNAVKQISSFSLPKATVLLHEDPQTVTLNKGTEDGLYNGLPMVVTRIFTEEDPTGNEISMPREVGRIKVTDATADESYATVTDQGIGIHSEDVATAIYQLPPYFMAGGEFHIGQANNAESAAESGGGRSSASRAFTTGTGGLLVGLLVAAGLVALASNGVHSSGTSFGGGSVGGINANIVYSANVTPAPNSNASLNSYFVPLAIQINFNEGQLTGDANVIEYHIFRNPAPPILGSTALIIDQTTTVGTTTTTNTNALSNVSDGEIPTFVVHNAGSPVYDSAGYLNPITFELPDPTNDAGVETTTIYATLTTNTAEEYPIPVGLNVGDQVSYSVNAVYTVPNFVVGTSPGNTTVGIGSTGTGSTSTTTTTTGSTFLYSVSQTSTSSTTTYLQPPIIRAVTGAAYPIANPTSNTPFLDSYALSTGPQNVTIDFPTVYCPGVSTLDYALQISTDPQFGSNIEQYTANEPMSATSVNFRSGAPYAFPSIDLTQISAFKNVSTLYVRVGVRDDRNGTGNSNPYIWSSFDPNQGAGGTLPASLTPGNAAATTAARKEFAVKGTSTTPVTGVFIKHAATDRSAGVTLSYVPGAAVPSVTPHVDAPSSLHPGVGGLGNIVRPSGGH